MGKVTFFLILLIFIDILFIVTGQLFATGTPSLSSIVLNGILNLVDFNFSGFFTEMIGDFSALFSSNTGIGALLIGSAVTIGSILFTGSEQRIYIPIAFSLGLLIADFVVIYSILRQSNELLALMIMAPIILIYTFTIVEWLRGKD